MKCALKTVRKYVQLSQGMSENYTMSEINTLSESESLSETMENLLSQESKYFVRNEGLVKTMKSKFSDMAHKSDISVTINSEYQCERGQHFYRHQSSYHGTTKSISLQTFI